MIREKDDCLFVFLKTENLLLGGEAKINLKLINM